MNTISTIDSKSDNAQKTLFIRFCFIAFAHLINDLMQSVIPAAYRFLKKTLV
jgi:FSR family fosmidomycin resistance protein-like MFS transporter